MTENKKALQAKYIEKFGKRPFNGWGEEKLLEKLGETPVEAKEIVPAEVVVEAPKAGAASEASCDSDLARLRRVVKDGHARAAIISHIGLGRSKEEILNDLTTDSRVTKAGGQVVGQVRAHLA